MTPRRLHPTLLRWLDRRAQRIVDTRPPDLVIGAPDHPYLQRWHILPRNPLANLYLHRILRSDDDRALHDPPWPNLSILLRWGYDEVVPAHPNQLGPLDDAPGGLRTVTRCQGDIILRGPWARHRLEIDETANEADLWRCTVCGRTGTVGRCCGEETREPVRAPNAEFSGR